ncbi:MAG: alr: alanine racemase [Verrucomicrobiales bacterium]|nr:alr: alanine racemase [Verrucomicrobiales bacterium]
MGKESLAACPLGRRILIRRVTDDAASSFPHSFPHSTSPPESASESAIIGARADSGVPTGTCPARTWVEIDLEAVRHNCRAAQACLGTDVPGVLAVVKADGYGLGMVRMAKAMRDLVRAFAVANVTEAMALRAAGISGPIYILGPALPGEWASVADGGFCAAVSSMAEATGYALVAEKRAQPLPVHVVVDTGMGRIGCLPEEAPGLLKYVMENPWLELDSVASHYPSADDDETFTRAQAGQFEGMLLAWRAQGLVPAAQQLANSAGLTGYPVPTGAWARAGLMLYGVSPLPREQHRLRRVVSWKAAVTLVKHLPADHGVSYGRTFLTTRPTVLAVLGLGYADGYPRQASGQGAQVLLSGHRCPVLGRVTMDQIMVDATDLPDPPSPGDEAVLVGIQGDAEITAVELAGWGGTIAWDLFTGLGARVKKCYIGSTDTTDPTDPTPPALRA